MPLSPEKQFEKVEKLFEMVSEEYVKPEEFILAFETLEKLIKDIKAELETKDVEISGDLKDRIDKVNSLIGQVESRLLKNDGQIREDFKKNLDTLTQQIYLVVNEVRDLIPEIPSLIPLEARIAEVEAKIPKIPDEITPYQVRDKLEGIDNESEKLKVEAIKELRKELDEIWEELKKKGGRSFFGGGFNYSAMNFHIFDDETLSGTKNGVNTVFTISNVPSPASSLKVYRNGARQRVSEDYTVSGGTITFTIPPESTEILFADYRA